MRVSLAYLFLAVASNVALVPSTTVAQGMEGLGVWTDLVAGDTLDRWFNPFDWGEAHVEDGVVTLRGDEKWFLVSEDEYGDFIFEADVKVPEEGNSGLQFRAHYEPNRLWGYQAEVDPSERAWAGGLYDEGRRGWLNPLDGKDEADARAAFKPGEWNTYRITAGGPHIQIWVNGVKTTDYYDTADLIGHLALQHHGEDGLEYQFRNIRVQELGYSEWVDLLGPDSLDNWRSTPGGSWRVEDGVIVGTRDASDEGHGLLISQYAPYDFAARLKFQVLKGNSGFYFHADETDGGVQIRGLQAEIEPNGHTGGLYEVGGKGWIVKPDSGEVAEWLNPPGEWNELSVVTSDDRIVVHVNDHLAADIEDAEAPDHGPFALELSGGMDVHAKFKDLEILQERH